jgi:hypothetical protein
MIQFQPSNHSHVDDAMAQLAVLFSHMDDAYRSVAEAFGFECGGCEDNCCETRFHHHTLVEYLYIKKGIDALPDLMRRSAVEKAISAVAAWSAPETSGSRIMCPVNSQGRCGIYPYRPMICRFHGIPSAFRHPVRGDVFSPGCAQFDRLHPLPPSMPLDRTPFYRRLADIEKILRNASGIRTRIRMTVADMIVHQSHADCGRPADGPPPLDER